jgi:UDP-2-acetamido-2,6-beta-L-arabino-hexul-4-ose reductase
VVNDEKAEIELCYIDDVVKELLHCLKGKPFIENDYCSVKERDTITVGSLKELIVSFKESREKLTIPNLDKRIEKNLYSTYLSFMPEDDFSYPLKMNVDSRGSFTEFLRTNDRGQVSVNISKPGITKGNHWHHTKNEKFLVVSGQGVIRFRKINSDEVIEYFVSSEKLQVVDIPVGYTHNIENLGNSDMVTIMWVNEPFDPQNPDTYYVEV